MENSENQTRINEIVARLAELVLGDCDHDIEKEVK